MRSLSHPLFSVINYDLMVEIVRHVVTAGAKNSGAVLVFLPGVAGISLHFVPMPWIPSMYWTGPSAIDIEGVL